MLCEGGYSVFLAAQRNTTQPSTAQHNTAQHAPAKIADPELSTMAHTITRSCPPVVV